MEYHDARKAYRKVRKISGWFAKEAAMTIAVVDAVQKKNHWQGDIFEIGVHHGKSALFLHHCLVKPEVLRVCDLFGSQIDNISRSGAGDKQTFLTNCRQITGNTDVPIFEKPSDQLTTAEIGTTYRLFHVDGGHSCGEALTDLELAKQAILDFGIIILDDPFRHEWPGVTEAALAFLQKYPDYTAFLVGFNKLLISKASVSDTYIGAFDNAALRAQYGLGGNWSFKTVYFAGNDLRCLYQPTYLQNPSLKVRLHQWLKRLEHK